MVRAWIRPRSGRWGAGATAVLLAATVGGTMGSLAGSATQAAPADNTSTASQAVIVILKDQLSDAPPDVAHLSSRRSRAGAAQQSVMGHLSGAKPSKVRSYTAVNGFAATVTA